MPTHWIGIDGEGIGHPVQRYTLLAASDNAHEIGAIERLSGLGTAECLEFILSLPPNARLAGYYLGYD